MAGGVSGVRSGAASEPVVPGVLVRLSEVAAGEDECFDLWYQSQQLLEPLAIDGFESARRYRVTGGEPAFMTVYGCHSFDALAAPASRAALARGSQGPFGDAPGAPARVRDTMQLACRQTWSAGAGMGGSAIVVQCKPMQGREAAARAFIKDNFGPENVPAMVKMSLWEVDSAMADAFAANPASGSHWVLMLESYDVTRMALAMHEFLLHCESDKTGLLVGSWTRYQLISAHDRRSA